MKTKCNKCKYEYNAKEEVAGTILKCPKCGTSRTIKRTKNEIHENIKKLSINAENSSLHHKLDTININKNKLKIKLKKKFILLIFFFLVVGLCIFSIKSFTFYKKISEKPDKKIAFKVAKKFLQMYGSLSKEKKYIFLPQYTFKKINILKQEYKIKSKIITYFPSIGEQAKIAYIVKMKYLRKNKWRFIACKYDINNLKIIKTKNSINKTKEKKKIIINPFLNKKHLTIPDSFK